MEPTLQEKLETLLKAYTHYYDVDPQMVIPGTLVQAAAYFHQIDEQILISRKHIVDSTEQHEYVYFVTVDHLDLATLETQITLTREAGMSHIVPSRHHRCSIVTMVILANTIDADAQKRIKKENFRKNFRLALHGWMEYHIAAMECSTQSFLSNPAGREARKTLERNFRPKSKKGRK